MEASSAPPVLRGLFEKVELLWRAAAEHGGWAGGSGGGVLWSAPFFYLTSTTEKVTPLIPVDVGMRRQTEGVFF